MQRFKHLELVVFDPPHDIPKGYILHRNETVYFLGDIPHMPGHCMVVTPYAKQTMHILHTENFRKAKEKEL